MSTDQEYLSIQSVTVIMRKLEMTYCTLDAIKGTRIVPKIKFKGVRNIGAETEAVRVSER